MHVTVIRKSFIFLTFPSKKEKQSCLTVTLNLFHEGLRHKKLVNRFLANLANFLNFVQNKFAEAKFATERKLKRRMGLQYSKDIPIKNAGDGIQVKRSDRLSQTLASNVGGFLEVQV